MEYSELIEGFGPRSVLIMDTQTFSRGVLDLQEYLEGLPQRWTTRFFESGVVLSRALEDGDLQTNTLAVLPSDRDLIGGVVNILAGRQRIKLIVVVGECVRRRVDRHRKFYYGP